MEEEEALPDHLRCARTDGRQWRCTRRVMDNKKLCEIHHLQGLHRQHRQKVPDSLKLQRKRRRKVNRDAAFQNRAIRANGVEKLAKRKKRKRPVGASEALDGALKKMKLRKGDLQLDLIRTCLQRQVERRRGRELQENSEGELVRDLPNGLMAISSTPLPRHIGNASSSEIKVGIDSSPFTRRRFRSKNIAPMPIGSMQIVPYKQNVENLRKGKRKNCHWCRKSFRRTLIKCSCCQKELFCTDCIKERYFDTQEEVRIACPVCLRTCSCKTCLLDQSKDVECKEFLSNKNKVDRILHFHYLICMLLPALEQINQDQSIELEIEAKIRDKTASEVQIRQVEFSCNKICCCNNCKNSIVNFHRSCPNCSYNLCLGCCWEFCQGSIPGGSKEHVFKCPTQRKSSICGDKKLSEMRQINETETGFDGKQHASSGTFPSWKARNHDGSISCPPTESGGCGGGLLDLRCVFPLSWTKELETSAEEIICSYDFPETSDVSSCCALCIDPDHKASGKKQLREAAGREDSNDNFLYCPTIQDIHCESLEHFQTHWAKGHPVIIRKVILSTSALSWDPVVMFCTYLERSIAKYATCKEAVQANYLDWCEVEIGVQQLFMGSLAGGTRANMWHEMLKLKGWLSSHLFREHFPDHYAETIHGLPLQEYLNPKSGLLNLAVNLPRGIPEADLGPCIYISYGSSQELVHADSVTKLCYDSHDLVNILAHTTDVPISKEQISKIKLLLKKYRTQDQRESMDQKTANKMKQKSSLPGESMKDAELQDTIRETNLHQGVDRVPSSSCATHEVNDMSIENGIFSHAEKYDSDSEASILSDACGAQWDVFRRQDVPKLLEYLRRHSNEFRETYGFPKQVIHPILDQIFFLDTTHKLRLKEEFKIEPWTFKQRVGEAVIIPAGCPYQIKNLKSCVNVVMGFVSPENVAKSIQLIDELRLLPDHHKAKKDNLEVKKMSLYSMSAAIKEIRKLTCADGLAESLIQTTGLI
ncbi:lysine-specific demethylase JMJ28 isoform X2 [Malania oleifera]|uniref:lysine-specific demethylase JMJ28 isoform X2 n=1 Tax=Malania oleifera TaxID=397392 RepID=UPI0025AECDB4|nr:lysine-specific demethylase JMJ28 isoform X2 [Malania oleifera]